MLPGRLRGEELVGETATRPRLSITRSSHLTGPRRDVAGSKHSPVLQPQAGQHGLWPLAAEECAQLHQRLSVRMVGLCSDVLHQTYLPFTADQLRQHFAPVAGPGERDRHLQYYLASIEEAQKI